MVLRGYGYITCGCSKPTEEQIMTLTIGTGPFGDQGEKAFNFEVEAPRDHVLFFEDSPRRVRVMLGGETVAENAVWSYPDPIESAPPIAGYLAFYWRKMDHWYEEDEEVFVHPRDPYHRGDMLESSRHVKVSVNGEVVAETNRPIVLFETGLPPRYYIPPEDVREDVLLPSDRTTQCPYKGVASYYSVEAGGERVEDLIWYYPEPLPEVGKIGGLVCFFNEKVDLEVDGEEQDRPRTQWS